jgi:Secretory lipase
MTRMLFVRRGLLPLALMLASLLAAFSLSAGTALASPLLPTQDPFYSYSGALSGVPAGTVLRTRSVSFTDMGLTVPVTTKQILYRTTDELGQPTVAVATVIEPLLNLTHKIVSYQWAYDGLASNCDPSYAIQGGSPTESTNQEEQLLLVPLLLAGDTVVTSDYESEENDFAAGREEGYLTLDGIRAAEQLLGVPASTQVALLGYSGGAIASDWAAEQAPSYAPSLDIVGTAMGGIAVDLAHNLSYVNGSQEWSGAIPAALVGIARAFGINIDTYLSSYGVKVVDAVGSSCLQSDLGSYPGLTYQKLLKPQYTNIDQIPVFVNALNTLIMGTAGTPKGPLYMGVGDADGTGDDVMVDADDEALAQEYCARGVPVEFTLYKNEDHGTAALVYLPDAITWVLGRLSGLPADNGCSRVPAGDSLAPLVAAAATQTTTATLRLTFRSESGRKVRVRVRAQHAAIKGISVELLNSAGKVLASKKLNAAAGRLLSVTLKAHARLRRGTYRIIARASGRTLAKVSFKVRA